MDCRRTVLKLSRNGVPIIFIIIFFGASSTYLLQPTLRPALRCNGAKLTDHSFMHKFRGDTISAFCVILVMFLVPYVQMLLTELVSSRANNGGDQFREVRIRKEAARLRRGFRYSLAWYCEYLLGGIFMISFNAFIKNATSSARPHYVDSCRPNFTAESCVMGWVETYDCTNRDISRWGLADASKSFPSGHAALAVYSAIFMIIYQHRRFSLKHLGTPFILWCHLIWLGWGAYVAVSRVTDHRHHPVDVLCGSLIGGLGGAFMALFLCNNFREKEVSEICMHMDGRDSDPVFNDLQLGLNCTELLSTKLDLPTPVQSRRNSQT